MKRSGFTGRLARATATHPWRTITVWIVVLAASFMLAGNLDDVLTEARNPVIGSRAFAAATDRAARTLLGRKLQVRVTIQTPGKNQAVERKALTVAVHALYIGDYSIHLRFEKPLKS